jgi:hypothetical protein
VLFLHSKLLVWTASAGRLGGWHDAAAPKWPKLNRRNDIGCFAA